MKILHYVGVMNRAGLETFIMNIYRNIDRNNYQFGFLCTRSLKGDYDSEILGLGGKIYHIEYSKSNSKLRHISNYLELIKELKNYLSDYQVFHIHHYHAFDAYTAARAALAAGFKKVIVHSHSASTDSHFKLHKIFRKQLPQLPITMLACSEASGEWMFDSKTFTVIKNGIDVDKYKYSKEIRKKYRKELDIDNCYVWGHVGRFDAVKNHEFLIRLFASYIKRFPELKLVLVGEGSKKTSMESLCKELQISENVLFLGLRNDVANILQAVDVFVFPSIYEGVSLSIIEAETAGLPCVTSDTVSSDVDILNVKHISLKEDIAVWSKTIKNIYEIIQKSDRNNAYLDIRNSGYDIKETSKAMTDIYG